MDAMRDLLQNIRPVAPPVEGDEQQDNNEGDGVERAEGEHREEWDWDVRLIYSQRVPTPRTL